MAQIPSSKLSNPTTISHTESAVIIAVAVQVKTLTFALISPLYPKTKHTVIAPKTISYDIGKTISDGKD